MSRANPVAIPKVQLSEKQFTSQIVDLAKLFGWRRYHTWRSINSPAGFPDEVLVRRDRLVFAELKAENGKVSPLQQEWLDDLGRVPGVEVYLWRPSQLDEITGILR
jgi:hypothetical protein